MNKKDDPESPIIQPLDPESSIDAMSIMPGFNTVLKINHQVRKLIFDYSLTAAILGLFRFDNNLGDILNFLTLLLLNLVMTIHIGHYWKTFKNKKIITIANLSLSFLNSFIVAVLVRGIFSVFSLFIPLFIVLNASVGHALLTWLFGRATNQLYLSAKKIDIQTLEEILNNHKVY